MNITNYIDEKLVKFVRNKFNREITHSDIINYLLQYEIHKMNIDLTRRYLIPYYSICKINMNGKICYFQFHWANTKPSRTIPFTYEELINWNYGRTIQEVIPVKHFTYTINK